MSGMHHAIRGSWRALGVAAMHYNPAGLAYTHRSEVQATYQSLVQGISHGEIGYSKPFTDISGWGVGMTYLDYGKIPRVTLSDLINNATPSGSFSGADWILKGAYGRQYNEFMSFGVTAKLLHQELANIAATSFMVDLGMVMRPSTLPIRLALTGANIGTNVNFDVPGATANSVSEQLPALFRIGAAVDLLGDRLTFTGDVEKVRDQDLTLQLGAEARVMDMIALRIGWDGRIDADEGLTGGIGVKVNDLALDYAFIPYGSLGNNHRVSLNYKFGPNY